MRAPRGTVRLLVAGPNPLVRESVAAIFSQQKRFRIITSGISDSELRRSVASFHPNVAIIDLEAADAIATSRTIVSVRKSYARVRIVLLTSRAHAHMAGMAMKVGAAACVLGSNGAAGIIKAVGMALAGQGYLSPDIAAAVAAAGKGGADTLDDEVQRIRTLSVREVQMLRMIAEGLRTRDIAERLSLSVKTVEKHRSNLMRKIGLRGAAAVTVFAQRHGFINASTQARRSK